jgi:lipoprotein-releasing system ATP-binding protein
MTETPTVSAEQINKTYHTRSGALTVLRDADLSLSAGESVAIMGPSGSGKSTLLNILGTLEPPDSGDLTVAGTHPFNLGPRDVARFRNRTIGFVFQEHHLLPQCNVVENVLIPTLADRHDGHENGAVERATSLLERVGLSGRVDHKPAELSGGERQRVAIARALINQPALLLADEPTGNLDRKTAESIAALLVETYKSERLALVVVTHSESLARQFDRTLELVDGTLQPAT